MIVQAIGDTHAPAMHKRYVQHCAKIRDAWQPERFIHVGDIVDWHAISFHSREPGSPTAEQEIEAARKQLHKLHDEFPEMTILIGNHDAIPARKFQEYGLPLDLLPSRFLESGWADFWDTPGWTFIPRFGSVEVDKVIYQHGDKGIARFPSALNNAKANFRSCVQGHHHAQAGVWWYATEKAKIFGLQTGCGVDHRVLTQSYGRKFNAKPILGCGVVIDGTHAYCETMDL